MKSPYPLAEALELFNKAEPDLMLRDAFGHRQKCLSLSPDFRERLQKEAGVGPVPTDAWWAIEYPFTCLAGALAWYARGNQALQETWENSEATAGRVASSNNLRQGTRRLPRLATSGREDADFVIAFRNVLILLEAKGYTHDSNDQIDSKLDRFELLKKFYECEPGATEKPITFRFVLWSPTRPVNLKAEWPDWARSSEKFPHITMDLGNSSELYTGERFEENPAERGDFRRWKIKLEKRRAGARTKAECPAVG